MSIPRGDPAGPDTRPGGGLWSGLWRRLAGSPAAQAASGRTPAAPESAYSREALQAMIERKRHNDFMRQREFDMLRKLRRGGPSRAPAAATPPTLFHSSIPSSPGERATTLRKIDEIEAQMSIQWRRVKALSPSVRPSATVAPIALAVHADPRPAPAPVQAPGEQGAGAAPSVPSGATMAPVPAARAETAASAGFVHDPQLEEAALLFASGDVAAAESAILAMLAPGHPRAGLQDTWQALFDLYRATGRQVSYEDQAAEFARRFQRSPPQWRRLDEAEGASPDLAVPPCAVRAPGEPGTLDWACPPVLEGRQVWLLRDTLAGLPQPWRLSWADLASLEPDAVAALAHLVAHWARQRVRLQFAGADRLERLLDARTACGDRSGDPAWWALRLDWLRAMGRCDEFELVALDYCVTYEVSPPSWDPPLCEVRLVPEDGEPPGGTGFDAFESRVSAMGSGEPGILSSFDTSAYAVPATGELAGTLEGDLSGLLARLDARLQDAERLVISCARLERIDFEAAGALLNWVSARQAEGREVHLADVHRLVATLFGALGLATLARITLRED